MVVSARAEASSIGLQILQQGGNAFDAMIATELALAVSHPTAGNISGGGFMVFRKANGDIGSLDYREKAPLAAHKNMYLDSLGNVIPDKSTLGALAVGVPGTIAGIFEVHQKFGSLPFKQLIAPAIALAKKGVVVTEKQAARLNDYQEVFSTVNKEAVLFTNTWNAGDTIKYTALAKTLQRISDVGRDEFYQGKTAQEMVNFLQANGGILSLEDLKNYEAVWRAPMVFSYKDLELISMGPPSSGGTCLAQILNSLENYPLARYGHHSVEAIQLITEAERRSYADRNHFLGDPDFVKIPLDTLTSKTYAVRRMQDVSLDKATPSSEVAHGQIIVNESEETTHYSIVDAFGNAVSVTTTLNGGYGSKLFSNTLGFFFNNQMDDFSSKPGTPNLYGLIGAEANAIAPGKRMLSSMTPTIVVQDGQLKMVVGTPGGSSIITSVTQTLVNVFEFNMGMQEAVNAPRFHHQWLPDNIQLEPGAFTEATKKELEEKGYQLYQRTSTRGAVDGILVLPNGQLEGGADRRGDDTAMGF